MDRPPVSALNDHAEIVPCLAEQEAALGLIAAQSPKHRERSIRKVDRPACPRRLRIDEDELVSDGFQSTRDPHEPAVEVDVLPTEPEHLAAAHPARRREDDRDVEPV